MRRRADLLVLLIARGHPEAQAGAGHERQRREVENVVEHGQEAVGALGRHVARLQVVRLAALEHGPARLAAVAVAQHLEALAHAVRRVAHDAVEPAARAQRRVGQVRDEGVAEARREPVLHVVAEEAALALAADRAAVDVGAEGERAEVRAGDGEGAGADEGVVEELGGGGEGDVGGDEREGGVHGRRADVLALLEVVLLDDVALCAADEAAEPELSRLGDPEGEGVKGPVLEDAELHVGVLHAHAAREVEEGEGLDQGALRGERARALEAVHGELEGLVLVGVPDVGRGGADVLVQRGVRRAAAPELVDGFGGDAPPHEPAGLIVIGELDNAEG